ncbi:carnitine dehydratase [Arthrobacter sp. MYb23]|uniref:CaiB/BaiF CoA transferase family protein n=1 Tax=unclassified Arthrobacter TaxID=235627 RepID=UPI000CFD9DDA|nr:MULTISPECIES: CaiB/BaiF CoA-transferase family protein [unclassified Arthrobacter]PRB41103.1 carnitine dehydratase [Arthrobacter sp. MYb51]PRB94773.1 carnitine dehydratase [Arthrobacter sp. MYb23]
MPGPLEGLKVIELAGLGPGPHAAMMLADLGADVVRIERPGHMEQATLPATNQLLRNRRLLVADLKNEDDLAMVLQLIEQADVLIEGFRPGVAERLGLGPDTCLATNAGLVYARMTGWGQSGPMRNRAGHDINFISLTGALHSIGNQGQKPVAPLNLVGDFGGGSMFLVVGVLSALFERQTSGQGQVVDAAMVDGTSVLMQMMWEFRGMGDWSPERGTNLLDTGAPFYDTYTCADGKWVAVGALEPQFYAQLLVGLGLDSEDLPAQMDRSLWPTLRSRFTEVFSTKDRDHWSAVFAETDACVSPVLSLGEAVLDPHLVERGTIIDVEGIAQGAPAPRFSRTPTELPRPPRAMGPDHEAVLRQWLDARSEAKETVAQL